MPRVKVCYVRTILRPQQKGRVVHVFHEGDEVGPGEEDGPVCACTDWMDVTDDHLRCIMEGECLVDADTGEIKTGVDAARRAIYLESTLEDAAEEDKPAIQAAIDQLWGIRFGSS